MSPALYLWSLSPSVHSVYIWPVRSFGKDPLCASVPICACSSLNRKPICVKPPRRAHHHQNLIPPPFLLSLHHRDLYHIISLNHTSKLSLHQLPNSMPKLAYLDKETEAYLQWKNSGSHRPTSLYPHLLLPWNVTRKRTCTSVLVNPNCRTQLSR